MAACARIALRTSLALPRRPLSLDARAMSSRVNVEKPKPLQGQVALVTGASRGVGRGIALQLGEAGATVYVTGREPSKSASATDKSFPTLVDVVKEISNRHGEGICVYCDHSDPEQIKKLFEKIAAETGRSLDILVNSAFSGAPSIDKSDGRKFFECDPLLWDEINNVGLRNAYICSVYAARLMVPRRSGLIVNIGSAAGIQYFFNVPYGVGKAAVDRLSADIAHDLKSYGVTAVSLWPGTVRTETTVKLIESGRFSALTGMSQDFAKRALAVAESPEFVGRAVVALASDRHAIKKTGRILLTGDLSSEYAFVDVDGRKPSNMRNVNAALDFFGWPGLANLVPDFFKVPAWALHMSSYKF